MQSSRYAWTSGDYAVSLARISDSQQTSLGEQHRMNRAGAKLIGLDVPPDGQYDDIESRTTGLAKRHNLQSMLARLRDSSCRAVIIWDDSRVLGDPQQALDMYYLLRAGACRLFTKEGHEIDVSSHEGLFFGLMKGWNNQGEVLKTRKRVKDTHREKARMGRMVSRAPFAVRSVPLHEAECAGACKGDLSACEEIRKELGLDQLSRHGELTKKNTVWVIHRGEFAQLELMYQCLIEGCTWGEIERRLDARGWKKPTTVIKRSKVNIGKVREGKSWDKASIARIIRNGFYKGDFTWNKTEVVREHDFESRTEKLKAAPRPESEWVTHQHQLGPLIDPSVWAEANNAADKLYRKRDNTIYPPLLFDDVVFCGRCGWKFVPHQNAYVRQDGEVRFQYYCGGITSEYSTCKKSHSIAENVLDWHVLGIQIMSQGRKVPDFEVEVVQDSAAARAVLELEEIEIRIKELGAKEENIEEMALERNKSKAWRDEKFAEVDADRAIAEAERARLLALPSEVPVRGRVPLEAQRLLRMLRDDQIPIGERQQSLRRLVDRIIIDRPSIRVILREQTAQA